MAEAPTINEEALRSEIVSVSHQVWQQGWVANHDGNLSARLGPGRFLATPTAVSKGDVLPEWLIVVNEQREVIQGTRRAFSELALHMAAYRARPDIGVVLHAHPPHATAFAVSAEPLPHPFMAEAVVSLGPELPLVPYHRPGLKELEDAVGKALLRADVLILEGHGVLAVGGSFEQAYLRMELVEHLASIALKARALGGVKLLPKHEVEALAAKGRPASDPSFGQAPQVKKAGERAWSLPTPAVEPSGPRPDVRTVVDEALRRLR